MAAFLTHPVKTKPSFVNYPWVDVAVIFREDARHLRQDAQIFLIRFAVAMVQPMATSVRLMLSECPSIIGVRANRYAVIQTQPHLALKDLTAAPTVHGDVMTVVVTHLAINPEEYAIKSVVV